MDNLRPLLLDLYEIWEYGLLGVTVGRIVGAVAVLALFLVLRGVLTRWAIKRVEVWVAKKGSDRTREICTALKAPVALLPVVIGLFIALEVLGPTGAFQRFGDRIVESLVVVSLFWALSNLVTPMSRALKRAQRVLTPALAEWLVKLVKALLLFIGGATLLELWGIEVAPLLAGLGLFGVAVALGAQDLFKNLISGFLVIAEQRFEPGDWILVDGVVEGTVETIGFRSTLVRRFDKAPVYVPNANLSDKAVTNFSEMTHRRIYWMIGVEYNATVDQLRQIRDGIEAYVLASDAFAKPTEVPTFVRIDRFSDSSIDIMVYCFTRTIDWGQWLKEKEALAYHVMKVVEDAGTGFAFPSQSLYVESLPGDGPERFVPPGNE